MKGYNYRIIIPGGNDTALVIGLEQDEQIRKTINDSIMRQHPNIEQVGFVSEQNAAPRLIMAGGEFCGNATRSAAWYFLKGKPGEITIQVSGVTTPLHAGVTKNGEAWAEMPVGKELSDIIQISDGFYLVNLEGISHIVITPEKSEEYIGKPDNMKESALSFMDKYCLLDQEAVGVIFQENYFNKIRIHPCVRVKAIETMFYETACGSGTIACGLVHAKRLSEDVEIPFIQPSGYSITASVNICGNSITEARISGLVQCDNLVYSG